MGPMGPMAPRWPHELEMRGGHQVPGGAPVPRIRNERPVYIYIYFFYVLRMLAKQS